MIVGLGNPGPQYAETRHNVGFSCVDVLVKRCHVEWQDRQALESLVAVVRREDATALVLVKPQTYMNRSGRAVKEVLDLLLVAPRNCLVVYDDMDLPFGTLRLRERGGPGTHNGMRSVIAELRSEDVARLRVGIGQSAPGEATAHVLSEFRDQEAEAVREVIARAADAALAWAEQGAAAAMNRYNNT